jgi:F-type H+-transporting ATPase subunit epsilon
MSKLHFSLVSPERELFSDDVDQVVVPGAAGQFGALALHAPTMSVVQAGVVRILDGSTERRIYVGGGMADVTPTGVIILAEDAVDLSKVDKDSLNRDLTSAREDLRDARDDDHKASAQKAVTRLEAILAAA